jgi:hypothetical protein
MAKLCNVCRRLIQFRPQSIQLFEERLDAGVIRLDIMSSHTKLTLSFRLLMSRTSLSRSVDMGVTAI